MRRRPFPVVAAGWSAAATSPVGRRLPLGGGGLAPARMYRLAELAARCWRQDHSCLLRALLAWWVELSRGADAAIVIGVRRDARRPFSAHAWVEAGGHPRGEARDPADGYQELLRYRSPLAWAEVAP
jgi:Transglutaminase-like superfamily